MINLHQLFSCWFMLCVFAILMTGALVEFKKSKVGVHDDECEEGKKQFLFLF